MKLKSQTDLKIGIFGLKITGSSAYEALSGVAKQVLCWDDKVENAEQFISQFGNQAILPITDPAWQQLDKIVISPGVPKTHAIFALAEQYMLTMR